MEKEIKFGTSGWRGIISDDFTFENVRLAVQAIAGHIKSKKDLAGRPVIIGGDARFLSDKFTETAAEVLAGNNIASLVCDRETPTPTIAFEIIRQKAAGGINFTASHNPAEYNGLKFSPSWGGPATPVETNDIEARIKKLSPKKVRSMGKEQAVKKGLIKFFDPGPYYMKRLRQIIDFGIIRKSKTKIAVDPLYSTGRGYIDRLLREAGADVTVINDHRDVLFGGFPPEPAEKNIKDLIALVRKEKAILGIATDGDADRYGIIDSDGSYIQANKILPLLLDYLMKTREWQGSVIRSVATSHMIDKVADMYGLKRHETPVGFKFIGEIMTKEDIIIGGEESNGLTVHRHVPEKDGIIACLLVAEMAVKEGKSIRTLLRNLEKKTGSFYNTRKNLKLTEDMKKDLLERVKKTERKFGKYEIKKLITIDGYKFMLGEDTWAMIRFSGTEPVVRLYAEAKSEKTLREIIKEGEKFVFGK